MLTLALDTSTPLAGVALGDGGTTLAESLLPVRATHSETVLPEIDRLLRASGTRPSDLECVVVGSGPGSFTGVRIAASLAKGLCFARRVPLHAWSSLAAMAAGTGATGELVCLIDARRGQVYAATYDCGREDLVELTPPRAVTLEDLLRSRPPAPGRRYAGLLPEAARARLTEAGADLLPSHLGVPRAAGLLWLTARDPARGLVADPERWEPEYVRASSAERARLR
jgi:tRNA threonylcarbamoyladenosine biosynthesis protein TsaB